MGGNSKKTPKTPQDYREENKRLLRQIRDLSKMNKRLLRKIAGLEQKIETLTIIKFRSKELEELLDRQNWPETSFVKQTNEERGLQAEFVEKINLMEKEVLKKGLGFRDPKCLMVARIAHALRRRATLRSKRSFWKLAEVILEDIHNINIQNMTGEARADVLLNCVAALEAIIDQTDLLKTKRHYYVFNPKSEWYNKVFPQSVPVPR